MPNANTDKEKSASVVGTLVKGTVSVARELVRPVLTIADAAIPAEWTAVRLPFEVAQNGIMGITGKIAGDMAIDPPKPGTKKSTNGNGAAKEAISAHRDREVADPNVVAPASAAESIGNIGIDDGGRGGASISTRELGRLSPSSSPITAEQEITAGR